MPGTFIISFDCEGKWGVADHLDDFFASHLTNTNINIAYEKIIALLDRWDINATFAFVGGFTMSVEEFKIRQEWFLDVPIHGKSWLHYFKDDVRHNRFDGWFNPRPFEIVNKEGQHEIAAHGFTHIPLNEYFISKKSFLHEINTLKLISAFAGRQNMTFVYPRNMIGHINELQNAGYIGYRDVLFAPNYSIKLKDILLEKIKYFLLEFNVTQRAQTQSQPNNIIAIPSGYFLNYRHGWRKKIPMAITLKRWENIIEDAIANNKVVHLWTHPENFLVSPEMFILLEKIIKKISFLKKQGEIINLTQREYSRQILF